MESKTNDENCALMPAFGEDRDSMIDVELSIFFDRKIMV